VTAPALYKATRPDGTDFYTGTVDYGAALTSGAILKHPRAGKGKYGPSVYFSVSTSPADCTGMKWPCRLFRVEPVGDTWTPSAESLPNKRACTALRVVEEMPSHETLGPQGEHLAALIDRCRALTDDEARQLAAARDAARTTAGAAAWAAARDAAWTAAWTARDAARDAAWTAPWTAARDAARALTVRDLIGQHEFTQDHYDLLTGPWRRAIGRLHPDDADPKEMTR
jgi:hypothetical protein